MESEWLMNGLCIAAPFSIPSTIHYNAHLNSVGCFLLIFSRLLSILFLLFLFIPSTQMGQTYLQTYTLGNLFSCFPSVFIKKQMTWKQNPSVPCSQKISSYFQKKKRLRARRKAFIKQYAVTNAGNNTFLFFWCIVCLHLYRPWRPVRSSLLIFCY